MIIDKLNTYKKYEIVFDKDFSKLSSQEQERVSKILKQLKEQGGDTGKPLSGISFFTIIKKFVIR